MTRHYVQRTQKLVFQSLLKYTGSFHSKTFLHNGSLQFLCNHICLFFYRFCIAYFPLHVACKYSSRFSSKPLKKIEVFNISGIHFTKYEMGSKLFISKWVISCARAICYINYILPTILKCHLCW